MSDTTNKETNKGLYAIIISLLLVLVVQSGYLIYHLTSKSASKAEITHDRSQLVQSAANPQTLAARVALIPRHSRRSANNPPASAQSAVQSQMAAPDFSDPWQMMEEMQERVNRLFDSSLSHSPGFGYPGQMDSFDFAPAIDLQEKPDAYILRGDLPGLEKDKINVTVKGTLVTIQGERQSGSENSDEKSGYYAQERSYGSFLRTITLPGLVDESKVSAKYENGVLSVTLPKLSKEQAASQKIAVS